MQKSYIKFISEKLQKKDWQVEHCLELLSEGATVPFISRYRKERTGGLDEVEVAEVKYWKLRFEELDKRKESILKSLTEQDKLSDELKHSVNSCLDLQKLEDIYLPYKPKRRTKATIAREKGLQPLADAMLTLQVKDFDRFVNSFISNDVSSKDDVLQGARDIIAENLSERGEIREELRSFYLKNGKVASKLMKGKEEDGEKFENYFDFKEDISRIPSHRLLAILRGADEGILQLKLNVDSDIPNKIIAKLLYRGERCSSFSLYEQLNLAIEDSYKRLLHPSIENESLNIAKERADLDSVKVFGENLRQIGRAHV